WLRFDARDAEATEHPELLNWPREHARQIPRGRRDLTATEARDIPLYFPEVGVAKLSRDVGRELVTAEEPERRVFRVAIGNAAIALELGLPERAADIRGVHGHLRGGRKSERGAS